MSDQANDLLDLLFRIANGRAVISRRETAHVINRSPGTIDDWIEKQLFPPWLQQTPGGPKEQLVCVVAAWLFKRRRARYTAPVPRGSLRRGAKLQRRGGDRD